MPDAVKKDKSILNILHTYNIPNNPELMLQTDGIIFHYQTKFLTSRTVYMMGKLVDNIPNALKNKNQLVILRSEFFAVPDEFHNALIDMLKEYNIKITGDEKELYSCINNLGNRLTIVTYSMIKLGNGWSLQMKILPHNVFIMRLIKR